MVDVPLVEGQMSKGKWSSLEYECGVGMVEPIENKFVDEQKIFRDRSRE